MLLLSTLVVASPEKQVFPPPITVQNDADFGAGIQRTMTLLATSTPEHHNKVKILFYGQSITKQKWWIDVADDLKKRFPNADLVIENRALGGFDAARLIRPAEHDLYPFYPDLTIFHVYGGDPEYEAIIANIRSRTTSEIAFHSDHITWLPTGTEADTFDELKTYEWHNYHSFHWLARIAKKYECELMEIRRPWRQYLKDYHLQPKALLSDHIHLNDQGNFLLASLIKPHLRYDPKFPTDLWKNLVRNYQVGTDLQWQNGKLVLDFEGNRIDAIAANSNSTASAKILIDGKKPSEYPELYTITRPSNAIGVDWPAIIQVSSEKPLLVEDWTAKITEINQDSSQFKFEVFGSKTGYDGSGTSDSRFVSNSGRIVIEARNWWLKTSQELSGKSTPKGFEIKWQVKPMFVDNYIASKVDHPAFESSTILAQNLTNSKHKLEIIADQNGTVPIQALRVYKPPLIPSIESKQPTSTP
ncbi:MAG: SGNH/GDSL hydrolase family protein [Coleofasciculaceae cyanobacterium]